MGRVLPLLALAAMGTAEAGTNWTPRVRAVADQLLAQQNPHGCIPDEPGGLRANQDAAMAYALLALAHAYRDTGHSRYRNGLRDGIEWLATAMERSDKAWVGSWRHAYSAKAPHVALPTPPCEGAEDGRGSTAASALFAYLVYLHRQSTGDEALALKLRPYVRAALDFLLDHNLGDNHLFYTGWYQGGAGSKWQLYRVQHTADQAVAYLGLRAGQYLLAQPRHQAAADRVAREIDKLWDRERRAFGVAFDQGGKLIPPADDPQSYVTQGLLAWVFGAQKETRESIDWLEDRHAPDGTFRRKRTDVPYVLPAIAFCLGAERLSLHASDCDQVRRWLREHALTPQGAVREAYLPTARTPSHLAGWYALAVLRADPFPSRLGDEQR